MSYWEYRAGQWTPIDYPFPEPTTDNVDDELKHLGYKQADFELGDVHSSTFAATLYTHQEPEQVNGYRYLVALDVGFDPIESVFVTTLPDLITLLKDCSTIVTAALLSIWSNQIVEDLIDQKEKLLHLSKEKRRR